MENYTTEDKSHTSSLPYIQSYNYEKSNFPVSNTRKQLISVPYRINSLGRNMMD